MQLSRDTWYARWYFWSVGIWYVFAGSYRDPSWRDTNLCFFLRVMLVYAPLVLLLHLLVYGGILAALIGYPLYAWGARSTGIVWTAIVAVLLALVALIWSIQRFIDSNGPLDRWQERRRQRAVERGQAGMPGFGALVWQGIVAAKQRVCPLIEFDRAGGRS